jgi:hypothetical protein
MILANHMFISRICLKIVAELEKLKKQILNQKKKGIMVKKTIKRNLSYWITHW